MEAGLSIAEMISSLSKPTVSLVLGGCHSIGGPLAVAADYTFIVPSGTIKKQKTNKKNIKLTTLEFDLLVLLIKNKSKCFSREEILDKVWGSDYFGTDRVVDDLIRRLRKKLDKLNVEAVYGYGYRLS